MNFEQKMAEKSDESLIDIINDRARYLPEAIEAAVAERQKRGYVFSEEELAAINEDITKKQTELIAEAEHGSWGNGDNTTNHNTELVIYSDTAIYAFAILFSTLFGAVMLAINFKKKGNKKGIISVLLFGAVFSFFVAWMQAVVLIRPGISILLNAMGVLVLKYLFWDKYIGKDTSYKAKPVWWPLLIALSILGLALLGNHYQHQS